jgi:hypothetical protein
MRSIGRPVTECRPKPVHSDVTTLHPFQYLAGLSQRCIRQRNLVLSLRKTEAAYRRGNLFEKRRTLIGA